MNINEIMRFRGTWRSYQARVLKNASNYLRDGHIHIVAAPGSGKTTLGIELIIRINRPVLILAPSITIREQWVARIEEAFLNDGINANDYITQKLKEPKLITVATYQALHSAITRYKGRVEENTVNDNDEDTSSKYSAVETTDENNIRIEEVDYSDFDLITTLKQSGVGVICLDECHHLRSEWWSALEELKKSYSDIKTIALTATPPYDSTPTMWEKYMGICGEIDEEITIPELVKEGSLCPHQDYVYFNYPTNEEENVIKAFEDKCSLVTAELMNDNEFAKIIHTHKLISGEVDEDKLLDNPEYLSALIVFYNEKKLSYPRQLIKLLGAKSIPRMNSRWMGVLLQGLLYDDVESFVCDKIYREELTRKLKAAGLIEKRKINMQVNKEIEKLLISSRGKINSIKDIVLSEYDAMNSELRMLILTDYIKKETEKNLGTDIEINELGVIPFFEILRRENVINNKSIRFGVLCGTIIIIPSEAKMALIQAAGEYGSKISFARIGQIDEDDYVKVTVSGDRHFLTSVVTEIFTQGYMQVLIGTKSLLGEGWDSPCINSLILASFVGSYMLSNQMRGRAIRVFKEKPEKTSNIWHLVCLKSYKMIEGRGTLEEESEDYQLLTRRMEQFLGLNYTEDYIENGIERLTAIRNPLSKSNVKLTNSDMLRISKDRKTLKDRWNRSLSVYEKMEVVDEVDVKDKMITFVLLFDKISSVIARSVAIALLFSLNIFLRSIDCDNKLILSSLAIVSIVLVATIILSIPKIVAQCSPLKRIQKFGNGMRRALLDKGLFEIEDNRCKVDDKLPVVSTIFLSGGSGRDKALFAKCVCEFFDDIDNQRYIMVGEKKHRRAHRFFCIPECFSKNKEDAEEFVNCMKPHVGEYKAVYTRNKEGRAILLEARKRALANRENRCIKRKKVKSALE